LADDKWRSSFVIFFFCFPHFIIFYCIVIVAKSPKSPSDFCLCHWLSPRMLYVETPHATSLHAGWCSRRLCSRYCLNCDLCDLYDLCDADRRLLYVETPPQSKKENWHMFNSPWY
jgi:hypothetical protein